MKKNRDEDRELFDIISKITEHWIKIEKVVLGPVIIVTRDINYFISKKNIWDASREIIVVENTEMAIDVIKGLKSDSGYRYGPPASTLIIDPRVIKVFEDFSRVKTLSEGNQRLIGELLILD